MRTKNVALAGLVALVLIALVVANRPSEQAAMPEPHTHAPATAPATAPAPPISATTSGASAPAETAQPGEKPVPHFHARLEDALPLPKILPASQFRIPIVAKAYRVAARIPEVLAQQPCYCWCDKIGHGSLVDCFATDHGAG
jgi:hypothetical protein